MWILAGMLAVILAYFFGGYLLRLSLGSVAFFFAPTKLISFYTFRKELSDLGAAEMVSEDCLIELADLAISVAKLTKNQKGGPLVFHLVEYIERIAPRVAATADPDFRKKNPQFGQPVYIDPEFDVIGSIVKRHKKKAA